MHTSGRVISTAVKHSHSILLSRPNASKTLNPVPQPLNFTLWCRLDAHDFFTTERNCTQIVNEDLGCNATLSPLGNPHLGEKHGLCIDAPYKKQH